MKRAMAAIWRRLNDDGMLEFVWPILQIHDSIMLDYPEELEGYVNEMVLDCLENTTSYSVPITASGEAGLSWGKMGKLARG